METTNIKEEKVDTTFDLDQEFEVEEVVSFLDKASLVGKRTVVKIINVVPGKYKHPLIVFDVNGKEYRLDLNRGNKNFLIENFGKKPKDWLGHFITLTAESGTYLMDGNQVQGVSVKFNL